LLFYFSTESWVAKFGEKQCATTADVCVMFSKLGFNNRSQLLDIPFYHGILNTEEIRRFFVNGGDAYCLIEHVFDAGGNDDGSLYLYIHHVNRDFQEKFKVMNFHHIDDQMQHPFKMLSSLITFNLAFHQMYCLFNVQRPAYENHPLIRHHKSLFDSSAFVIRNFFYYDRNFVESKLPKTLFHDVFAGATVKRERKRKLYEEEDEESD
jgi:hypothetical protein